MPRLRGLIDRPTIVHR